MEKPMGGSLGIYRRLLPCAAMRTFLPLLIWGTMTFSQYGMTRAAVVARDSVVGSSAGSTKWYLWHARNQDEAHA